MASAAVLVTVTRARRHWWGQGHRSGTLTNSASVRNFNDRNILDAHRVMLQVSSAILHIQSLPRRQNPPSKVARLTSILVSDWWQ